jgi:hypothetical protein
VLAGYSDSLVGKSGLLYCCQSITIGYHQDAKGYSICKFVIKERKNKDTSKTTVIEIVKATFFLKNN